MNGAMVRESVVQRLLLERNEAACRSMMLSIALKARDSINFNIRNITLSGMLCHGAPASGFTGSVVKLEFWLNFTGLLKRRSLMAGLSIWGWSLLSASTGTMPPPSVISAR